jgi:hypothetical protein
MGYMGTSIYVLTWTKLYYESNENIDRTYKNKSIYILSDSQAAIKALDKRQSTAKNSLGLPPIPHATGQT